MQMAVPIGEGKMIAVLGLNSQNINEIIENENKLEGVCEIANDNADGQVIISGDKVKYNDTRRYFYRKKN